MRRALFTICTLGAMALLAGCQGSEGAVSVRWRIVDLTLGDTYDPKSDAIVDREHQCCPQMHMDNHECDFTSPWVIQNLTVTLSDAATGESSESPPFLCGVGEETTPFTLPTGTWAIGLRVVEPKNGSGRPVPTTVPPPEVHTIVKGEIVNLQVIEIGVHPLGTSARPDAGGRTARSLPPPVGMVTF